MNRLVLVTASILLIGAQGKPEESNVEVTSLENLYNAQPSYGSGYGYGGNPYGGYPSMNYPVYPQYPGMNYPPIGGSYQYPSYGYPSQNTGYYPTPAESSTTKPNFEPSDPSTGATVIDSPSGGSNLNWNSPHLNWNPNGGYQYGVPNWQASYTPMPGGCYNRCRPKCGSFPRPMPPPLPPMPMPRPPRPMPRPMPIPRPNYGCRQVCRPMCNARPTCGMGGSEFNGNTMVCGSGKPNYGGGGWNYPQDNYGYPGMYRSTPVASPAVSDDEEVDDKDES